MRRLPVVVTVLALGVLAAGTTVSAASRSAGRDGASRTVHLTVHYSKFLPETVEVAPGTSVRFVVHNRDPIAHELIIGDGGVHDRHETGTEAQHGDRPGEVSVAAGGVAETTFVFGDGADGDVVFGCHLPGHWDYGMRGRVRVA